MTKSKSYNRIVFLTTLSVYLGLVLVGGTAPILAHSALTRAFDVHNEIELKDDLDNKPDQEPCSESKLKTNEQINLFFEEYAATVSSFLKRYQPEINGYQIATELNRDEDLAHLFPNLNKDFSLSLIESKTDKNQFSGKFKVASKFTNQNSLSIASFFGESLNFEICKSQSQPSKAIYENTTVSSENNQVFIVTRLPRAGIDSLLK